MLEPRIQEELHRSTGAGCGRWTGSLLLHSFVISHGSILIQFICVILEMAYDHVAKLLLREVLQEYSVSL